MGKDGDACTGARGGEGEKDPATSCTSGRSSGDAALVLIEPPSRYANDRSSPGASPTAADGMPSRESKYPEAGLQAASPASSVKPRNVER